MEQQIKILIADDYPLSLNGTKSYIESLGYKIVNVSTNGVAALNYIKIYQPSVAILDINMPLMDGLEIAKIIFSNKINTKVILLTAHKEIVIYNKALEYNVYAYILKDKAILELGDCLSNLSDGKNYVSPFLSEDLIGGVNTETDLLIKLTYIEKKILELIFEKKSTKQISEVLFLSEKSIEKYRTKIIEKLELPKEKNALLKWAIQNDLFRK